MRSQLPFRWIAVAFIALSGCGNGDLFTSPPSNEHTISGRVTGQNGGVWGVIVGDGQHQAVSDSSGNYTISHLSDGTYSLTALKNGLEFTPNTIVVALHGGNAVGQDFRVASTPVAEYTISGRVTGQSGGIMGVTVGDGQHQAVSDAGGNYTIGHLADGTYSLMASKSGLEFTPDKIVVSLHGKNAEGQNFVATEPVVISPQFIRIPAGSFVMGANGSYAEESPLHTVQINSFLISKYEVTQGDWAKVVGGNPSEFSGNSLRPVEKISWYDAVRYCNALSQREGLDLAYTISGTSVTWNVTSKGYRLPTEAEWEYACRAGTSTDYYSGAMTGSSSDPNLDRIGWYSANSNGTTHPVGQKMPNGFGLYDMTGNVFEWCWDWAGPYSSASQNNPIGPTSGDIKICRGGSWYYVPSQSRSAFRLAYSPDSKYSGVGMRVIRSVD